MSYNITDLIDIGTEPQPTEGEISILSVGRGDIKINFASDNPEEVEHAKSVIMDMLKRGYMLFVNINGKHARVKDFDPSTNEYILKIDKRSKLWRDRDGKNNDKSTTKRVPANKVSGTAVAPTSGG